MTKIFLLILVAGFALCGSTTGSGDNTISKATGPTDDDAKKASQTVRTFMELIAAGDNDKAKALMFNSKVDQKRGDPSTVTEPVPVQEVPPTFDWVTVLADRKFRLNKIIAEHSEGDTAVVETELSPEDLKSFIQKTDFELRKVGDQWKISDVDLVDKYAPKTPKSNGV